MNSNMNLLALDRIANYWNEYWHGTTWNFYFDPLRYGPSDTWASEKEWLTYSKMRLQNGRNSAYDVLLRYDFDVYFPKAEKWLTHWAKNDGHDPEYFYDIMTMFPEDHPVRMKFLGKQNFDNFLSLANTTAMQSLVFAMDPDFLKHLGDYLEKSIQSGILDLEEDIFRLLKDTGPLTTRLISDRAIQKVKTTLERMIELDKVSYINQIQTNKIPEGRSLWVRHEIAQLARALEWREMFEYLANEDWYWISFSDEWEGADNEELLGWSLSGLVNDALMEHADWVMRCHPYNQFDGAIAYTRFKANS